MQQGSDRTAFKNTLYMYNAMREEGGRRLFSCVYVDRDGVKSVHCRMIKPLWSVLIVRMSDNSSVWQLVRSDNSTLRQLGGWPRQVGGERPTSVTVMFTRCFLYSLNPAILSLLFINYITRKCGVPLIGIRGRNICYDYCPVRLCVWLYYLASCSSLQLIQDRL